MEPIPENFCMLLRLCFSKVSYLRVDNLNSTLLSRHFENKFQKGIPSIIKCYTGLDFELGLSSHICIHLRSNCSEEYTMNSDSKVEAERGFFDVYKELFLEA